MLGGVYSTSTKRLFIEGYDVPISQANGVNLNFEQVGSGQDLVLIQGIGGHSRGWALQRPAFEDRFWVTVFDSRCAGRSAAPDAPFSLRQMADDTAGLMAALDFLLAE